VASTRRVQGSVPFAAQGFDCVLSGLRDRVPGLYELQLVHEHSAGTDVWQHRLVVTVGGDADTGRYGVTQTAQGEAQTLSATRRCRLRAPEVYDDCLSTLLSSPGEPGSPAPACLAGLGESLGGWLEGCEARAPDCE
jgi:hypothetical protein